MPAGPWSIEWARLSADERREYYLAHRCHTCASLEGQGCTTPTGAATTLPHVSRMRAAMVTFDNERRKKLSEARGTQQS